MTMSVHTAVGLVCKGELSRAVQRLTSQGIAASATDEVLEHCAKCRKRMRCRAWTGGTGAGQLPPTWTSAPSCAPSIKRWKEGHGRHECGVRTSSTAPHSQRTGDRPVPFLLCRSTGQIQARGLRSPGTCATVSCTHGPETKVAAAHVWFHVQHAHRYHIGSF